MDSTDINQNEYEYEDDEISTTGPTTAIVQNERHVNSDKPIHRLHRKSKFHRSKSLETPSSTAQDDDENLPKLPKGWIQLEEFISNRLPTIEDEFSESATDPPNTIAMSRFATTDLVDSVIPATKDIPGNHNEPSRPMVATSVKRHNQPCVGVSSGNIACKSNKRAAPLRVDVRAKSKNWRNYPKPWLAGMASPQLGVDNYDMPTGTSKIPERRRSLPVQSQKMCQDYSEPILSYPSPDGTSESKVASDHLGQSYEGLSDDLTYEDAIRTTLRSPNVHAYEPRVKPDSEIPSSAIPVSKSTQAVLDHQASLSRMHEKIKLADSRRNSYLQVLSSMLVTQSDTTIRPKAPPRLDCRYPDHQVLDSHQPAMALPISNYRTLPVNSVYDSTCSLSVVDSTEDKILDPIPSIHLSRTKGFPRLQEPKTTCTLSSLKIANNPPPKIYPTDKNLETFHENPYFTLAHNTSERSRHAQGPVNILEDIRLDEIRRNPDNSQRLPLYQLNHRFPSEQNRLPPLMRNPVQHYQEQTQPSWKYPPPNLSSPLTGYTPLTTVNQFRQDTTSDPSHLPSTAFQQRLKDYQWDPRLQLQAQRNQFFNEAQIPLPPPTLGFQCGPYGLYHPGPAYIQSLAGQGRLMKGSSRPSSRANQLPIGLPFWPGIPPGYWDPRQFNFGGIYPPIHVKNETLQCDVGLMDPRVHYDPQVDPNGILKKRPKSKSKTPPKKEPSFEKIELLEKGEEKDINSNIIKLVDYPDDSSREFDIHPSKSVKGIMAISRVDCGRRRSTDKKSLRVVPVSASMSVPSCHDDFESMATIQEELRAFEKLRNQSLPRLASPDSSAASIRVLLSNRKLVPAEIPKRRLSSRIVANVRHFGNRNCPCFECRRAHGLRINESQSLDSMTQETDYVQKNIEDLKRFRRPVQFEPPPLVDSARGDKIHPLSNFNNRRGYGRIPAYLVKRKEEIARERKIREAETKRALIVSHLQKQAEEQRRRIERFRKRKKSAKNKYVSWDNNVFEFSPTCQQEVDFDSMPGNNGPMVPDPQFPYECFLYINGKVQKEVLQERLGNVNEAMEAQSIINGLLGNRMIPPDYSQLENSKRKFGLLNQNNFPMLRIPPIKLTDHPSVLQIKKIEAQTQKTEPDPLTMKNGGDSPIHVENQDQANRIEVKLVGVSEQKDACHESANLTQTSKTINGALSTSTLNTQLSRMDDPIVSEMSIGGEEKKRFGESTTSRNVVDVNGNDASVSPSLSMGLVESNESIPCREDICSAPGRILSPTGINSRVFGVSSSYVFPALRYRLHPINSTPTATTRNYHLPNPDFKI